MGKKNQLAVYNEFEKNKSLRWRKISRPAYLTRSNMNSENWLIRVGFPINCHGQWLIMSTHSTATFFHVNY